MFYGCDFYFFISASLISAVRQPIWLKFGTLTWSWCKLWSPIDYRPQIYSKWRLSPQGRNYRVPPLQTLQGPADSGSLSTLPENIFFTALQD